MSNYYGRFPFMGGMHGMSQKPVDNSAFYDSLGISKDATVDEIKKAFKRLAITHHPDKGGDPEKFKEICRAYEVLSDPEKRRNYDEYGEEGLDGQTHEATDIFDLFFGRQRRPKGPQKGENLTSQLEWTLEQFYTGSVRKMAITRNRCCKGCDGRGGPEDALKTCAECHGQGIKMAIGKVGPIITQSQCPCGACGATGKIMPADKKCHGCQGKGVVKEKKVLEIALEKGAPDGFPITFSEEADERPGEVAGDVVFINKIKKHDIFTRRRDDLIMEKTITLYEALTGMKFYITHLDGREIYLEAASNKTVQPGSIYCCEGEGMPRHGSPFSKGNLYIRFNVTFPATMCSAPDVKKALKKYLPAPEPVAPPAPDSDVEVAVLREADLSATQKKVPEEEDEDMHGGSVQCRPA